MIYEIDLEKDGTFIYIITTYNSDKRSMEAISIFCLLHDR